MPEDRLLLLGCGVFQKEVKFLIEKNGWPVDVFFLDSALHIDMADLSAHLTAGLERHSSRNVIVFYGACHPLMRKIVRGAGTFRTSGRNCLEMLLGRRRVTEELSKGAFFLLEDWARRWRYVLKRTFGGNEEVWKAVFQVDRRYLACVRTPISGDYRAEAETAGGNVGLPLEWIDAPLDRLESILKHAIIRKMKEVSCRT